MHIRNIWSKAITKLQDHFTKDSIIVSHKQFLEKLNDIDNIQLSENVIHTVRFALYRANLYYLGFGKSVNEDLETYTQYVKTIELTHLLITSVRSIDSFKVYFKNEQVKEQYQSVIMDNRFVLYNTFHYGAFIALVDYLAFRNDTVYVLVSAWMKEKPLERNNDKVGAFNSKNKTQVNVKLIKSDDVSCLLQLKEIKESCQLGTQKVAVVTLIDGNMLGVSSEDFRYSYYFLGNKVKLQQRITTIAERLQAPLVHCYMTSKDLKLELNIQAVFDFTNISVTSSEAQSNICYDFESTLTGNTIGMWTMVADLHTTILKRDKINEAKQIDESCYDENRFTEVYLGRDLLLFDSKYGIFYEAGKTKNKETIKDKILSIYAIA